MHDTTAPSPPSSPEPPGVVRALGAVAEACGQLAALAASAIVLLTAGLVLAFSLGMGSVKLQDLVLWLNAGMVMLGLGYALKHRAHVRIDVLSSQWSGRTRARVEVLGVLFLLLPFSIAVAWLSLDYVALSWRITERSGSTGGLAGLYLAKSLLPLGAALLALQGLAEALRAWPTAFDHSAAEAA